MLQCGFFRSNFAFAMLAAFQSFKSQVADTSCCAVPVPGSPKTGAGDGNRTHAASLEGWSSTIELHPQCGLLPTPPTPLQPGGGGGRIRTYVDISRQIYSLLPLTARPPLRRKTPAARINGQRNMSIYSSKSTPNTDKKRQNKRFRPAPSPEPRLPARLAHFEAAYYDAGP